MNTKERIILIITSVLLIGLLALSVGFAVAGPSGNISETSAELIDEESGEYIVYNAPKDYTLEIALAEGQTYEKDDFAVKDLQDTVVKTDVTQSGNTVTVKAPKGGYVSGEIYTIDLGGKGAFKSEELANAKKLMFCIECKEKSKIVYQDGVKELSGKKVQVSGGKIVVDGKYKDGDIIVADTNDDDIDEIYKLKNAEVKSGKTYAQQGTPTAEEIYKERDVFYYGYVDMTAAEIDTKSFVGNLEKTGVMDAFVDGAYAAEDTVINVKKEKADDGEFIFSVSIKNPASPNRQLLLTFGIKDKLLAKDNGRTIVLDNTLTITNSIEYSVVGEGKEETEARIKTSIESFVMENGGYSDIESDRIALVPMKVPIYGVVYASMEVGLITESEYHAELNTGIDTEVSFKQGLIYDTKAFKVKKIYGDIDGNINGYLIAKGKFDAFIGGFLELGLKIPYLINISIDAIGGPYLDAEGCFILDGVPKKPAAEGFYRVELGLKLNANVNLDILLHDEKIKLADKKEPLYVESNHLNLEEISLRDKLFNYNGTVILGQIDATYMNRLENTKETVALEDYKLKVDGKEVSIKDGRFKSSINSGKHNLELSWKYEGKEFSHTKDVEFSKMEKYFEPGSDIILGLTMAEIEELFGPLEFMKIEGNFSDEYWWYYSESLDLKLEFYNSYKDNRDTFICSTISGTAQQILGLNEEVKFGVYFEKNDIEYDGIHTIRYGGNIGTTPYYIVVFGITRDYFNNNESYFSKHEEFVSGYMVYNEKEYSFDITHSSSKICPESLCTVSMH